MLIAPQMSWGVRSGEVASKSTIVSNVEPNIASDSITEWTIEGIFGAESVAKDGGRFTATAFSINAMSSNSSESLDTATISKQSDSKACLIE
jgi:hypothetical protein